MRVRVCASSANLGPGFDCFGIAWQLWNTIEFLPGGHGLTIEGCDRRFRNRQNLAYRAYKAALEAAGAEEHPLRIRFLESQIPVSRGLGSSAALITGGVMAANVLQELGLTEDELLAVATRVEGHPDNIAPALFGGLTVSAMDGERVVTELFPLSQRLHFTALVPDKELSTELARSVLPKTLPREDAVFNVGRAALLLKALENGDPELLATGLQDRLHQPYRRGLIDGYDRAEKLAHELGAEGVCISGAGSTILCISSDSSFGTRIEKAAASAFPGWQVLPLLPDMTGAAIIE